MWEPGVKVGNSSPLTGRSSTLIMSSASHRIVWTKALIIFIAFKKELEQPAAPFCVGYPL